MTESAHDTKTIKLHSLILELLDEILKTSTIQHQLPFESLRRWRDRIVQHKDRQSIGTQLLLLARRLADEGAVLLPGQLIALVVFTLEHDTARAALEAAGAPSKEVNALQGKTRTVTASTLDGLKSPSGRRPTGGVGLWKKK